MIAYCGINCDECPSYIGTITGEMSLLVKMNEKYGDKNSDAVDFVCLGCKNKDVKLIASDCARCKIRICAMEREKDFCATCQEYESCDVVKPYRGDGTSIRDKRNALLQKKYLRSNS